MKADQEHSTDPVDALIETLHRRGLTIVRARDGSAVLRGPRHELTDDVREEIRRCRDELFTRLFPGSVPAPRPAGPPAREFLWHPGHRCVQTPDDPRYGMEEFAPVGAWWWRYQGEAEWKAVPGRGGECCSPLFPALVSVKESP